MRVWVNGIELWTATDIPFGISSSVAGVEDPSKIKGVTTTTITIAATPEARRAMGIPHTLTDAPHRVRLEFEQGGVRVPYDAVVRKITGNAIEVTATTGNADWFSAAKDQRLRLLDLGLSDIIDRAGIMATWGSSGGLVTFPLANYGALDARPSNFDVPITSARPALRLWALMQEGFRALGYTLQGNGRLADTAPLLTLLKADAEASVGVPTAQLVSDDSVGGVAATRFTPSADGLMDVSFGNVNVTSFDPFNAAWDGVFFRLHIYDYTDQLSIAHWDTPRLFFPSPGYGDVPAPPPGTFDGLPALAGHDYALALEVFDADTLPVPVAALPLYTTRFDRDNGAQVAELFYNGSSSYDVGQGERTAFEVGKRLHLASLAPDWTLADLVTLLGGTGVVFTTQGRTVTATFEDEYYRRPPSAFRDWRGRIDHSNAPARTKPVRPMAYALGWKQDAENKWLHRFALVNPETPDYGGTDIPTHGTAARSTITLGACPSINAPVLAGTLDVPMLSKWHGTLNVDEYPKEPRLLVHNGEVVASWTFDGQPASTYPITYYAKQGAAYALPFGNADGADLALSRQMKGWVPRNTADIFEGYLHLKDQELKDFDHGLPTLIDDGSGPAWVWVLEIVDHRLGEGLPTLCRMVRIPAAQGGVGAAVPVQYRTCAYYQDFTPFPGNTSYYSDLFEVRGFTVDGTNHGDYTLDGVDQYITVGGMDFYTGLIDALNSMAVPGFTFLPTAHLGTDEANRSHGGWFTIKAPADAVWSFEVTAGGLPHLRYSNAGIEAWDSGTSAWVPFEYIYGDGPPKGEPRNCTVG